VHAAARANGEPDRPADPRATIPPVRVAVIDVGSNSVRLLAAEIDPNGGARAIERDRVYVRLGDDAYNFGRIGARKLDELEFVAERFALRARTLGVERIETIVTAPGRQVSNADELVDVLADATRAPVLVLSAENEARLAWEGAVARAGGVEISRAIPGGEIQRLAEDRLDACPGLRSHGWGGGSIGPVMAVQRVPWSRD